MHGNIPVAKILGSPNRAVISISTESDSVDVRTADPAIADEDQHDAAALQHF